ncbi:MAG: hypothetical protein R3F56_23990 [Planctomycetota bacterium]
MNRQPHRTCILLLACSLAFPLTAQGPGQLPVWRTDDMVRSLTHLQIADALRTGLNSSGDRMALYVQGEYSVALGALVNGGQRAGIAAEVRRTDDGFEVAVTQEVAFTAGLEVYDGLEVNAVGGVENVVLFAWDTPAETARGLRLLSGAHEVALGSFVGMLEAQVEVLRQSAEALREAITGTRAARAAYAGMSHARADADAELARLQRDAARARANLSRLRGRIARAEARLDRLPGFLRGPVRLLLRGLQASLRADGLLARGIDAALHVAEHAAAAARSGLDGAQRTLDHAFRQEDAARRAHDAARAVVDNARAFAGSVGAVVAELGQHLRGVEFSVRAGAEAEAAVNPAGVSLENVGMGAGASSFLGATIGYRVRGGTKELTVRGQHDLELEAWAGMGVGARTEFSATTAITATWTQPRFARGFAFADLTTSVELDAALMAVVGAGVALRHGVGEHVALQLDAAQWRQAYGAMRTLAGGLTLANLQTALTGLECSTSTQARWIGQVVAAGGCSYAGWGLGIELGATWDDEGVPAERTVDAGTFLREMASREFRTFTADRLGRMLP